MRVICNRCEKEIEDASPYNFYVLHKECFREHGEQLIDEFLDDLDSPLNWTPFVRELYAKWEAKKNGLS